MGYGLERFVRYGDSDKMQTKTAKKTGSRPKSTPPNLYTRKDKSKRYKDSESYSISKSLMSRSITLPGLSPRSLWISWRMSLVWRLTEMTICTLLSFGSAGLRPAPGLAPPLLSLVFIVGRIKCEFHFFQDIGVKDLELSAVRAVESKFTCLIFPCRSHHLLADRTYHSGDSYRCHIHI